MENNFFNHSSDSMLLDPCLFGEFFSPTKHAIPIHKNNNFLFFFVIKECQINYFNYNVLQKEIGFDFFNEKLFFVKNYQKWQKEKKFNKEVPNRAILDFILTEALILSISDIHFNVFDQNEYIVKFKKDTVLYDFCKLNKEQYDSVILCLKFLSSLDVSKKNLPQSSSFFKIFKENIIDFRVSTHPTFNGERCVIRVLQKKNVLSIENLNLNENVYECVKKIINQPSGLILFTGPTNSGKTTFIHSILNVIAKKNLNIMTLEDPVEYRIPGIIQTNVSENGLTFYEGMRSILRQDPDIIFLGEIRDEKTARIAIQAALTGHKVFSTIHAFSVKGTISRLLDMNISFNLLSEALVSIFSQRLIRKIDNNGNYEGLNLVADAFYFDEKAKDFLRKNTMPDIKDNLIKNAYELIEKNITNESEIKRVFGL